MNKLMTASMVLCLAACAPSAPEVDTRATPAAAAAQAAVVKTAAPPAEVADDPAAVNQTIDEVLGEHARYEAVIRQLQQAVAANDAITGSTQTARRRDFTITRMDSVGFRFIQSMGCREPKRLA